MHENQDDLCDFVDSATKSWSYSRGWIFSLILRHCTNLLGSFIRNSPSDSVEGSENHHLRWMDPIDISSSDSDLEIEESIPREGVSGILPAWASGSKTNSGAGNGAPSWRAPSPKGVYASNGSSSNVNNHSQMKQQLHSSPNGDRGALNQHSWEDPKYFSKNGNLDQPWSVNSRIANVSGADYEKLSSQQALKRTLPASLHSHIPGPKVNNSVGKGSSSEIRDTHESPYHSAGISSTESSWVHDTHGNPHHSHGLASGNFKGYMKDHYSWNNNDDIMMYENNRSRILPPSLVHGASASSAQIVGSGDSMNRYAAGEERISGNDERLIYQAALEGLNQPKIEVTPPDGLLSVPLLRHQKIALAWMLQKETKCVHCLGGILADDQGLGKTVSMIALILVQKSLESKSRLEEQCDRKTEALNLDDDDENGSTILDKEKQDGESDDVKTVPEVSTSSKAFSRRRPAAGTLVVCPASVLRQWARELCDKVADESRLSVLVYHGGSRTKDPDELAKHDVVLTTYSIVTNEVPKQPLVDEDEADERNGEKYGLSAEISVNKKRKKTSNATKKGKRGRKGIENSSFDYDCGPLARVGWSRVILDEAQTIKNHRTQVARACCTLRAKRRWCLSGTPIQNAIDDLYSYFRFLRYDPYAVYKSFYNTIKVPISRNSVQGYKKLQAVLRAIMLRRTKGTEIDGQPIVKLPPKSIRLTKVDFSAEERAFYRQLEADSRSQFKAYAAAGTVNQNYANILLMLLRLRQACDHPLLVKGYNSDSVEKVSTDMAKRLPRDMVVNLLSCLEASYAICFVCDDPPEDPVVTMCGHVFCYQCVSEYLTGDDNMCPAPGCKEQLGTDNVFSKATLRSCMADDLHCSPAHSLASEKSVVHYSECSSSKIRAVIEILQSHCKSKSPISDIHDSSKFNQMSASERTNTESRPSDVNAAKHSTEHSNPSVDGPIKTIVFSQWTGMLDLVEMSLNENYIEYRRLDGTMTLPARDRAVKDFNNDPEVTVMLMSLKAGNLGLNMVAACHVILLDLWWNPTTEDQAVDRAHRIGQTRPVTVTRMTIKDTVEDRILALQEEKRKMVASAFGEDQSGGSASRLTVEDLRYLFLGTQQ